MRDDGKFCLLIKWTDGKDDKNMQKSVGRRFTIIFFFKYLLTGGGKKMLIVALKHKPNCGCPGRVSGYEIMRPC